MNVDTDCVLLGDLPNWQCIWTTQRLSEGHIGLGISSIKICDHFPGIIKPFFTTKNLISKHCTGKCRTIGDLHFPSRQRTGEA